MLAVFFVISIQLNYLCYLSWCIFACVFYIGFLFTIYDELFLSNFVSRCCLVINCCVILCMHDFKVFRFFYQFLAALCNLLYNLCYLSVLAWGGSCTKDVHIKYLCTRPALLTTFGKFPNFNTEMLCNMCYHQHLKEYCPSLLYIGRILCKIDSIFMFSWETCCGVHLSVPSQCIQTCIYQLLTCLCSMFLILRCDSTY